MEETSSGNDDTGIPSSNSPQSSRWSEKSSLDITGMFGVYAILHQKRIRTDRNLYFPG